MSVSEAARDFVDETLESMELAPRNEFHLEPRCRVCRNDLVRKKVNAMLACGGELRPNRARPRRRQRLPRQARSGDRRFDQDPHH